MLLDAVSAFDSAFDDLRHANDDTLMIRPLAERDRIHIAPEFSCTYHPRDSGRKFVAHSFHRGTVFVDGYYRPGTRFHRPLQAVMVAAPLLAIATVFRPKLVVGGVLGASAALGAGSAVAGVPRRNALALGLLAPVFGVAYGAGIVRGHGDAASRAAGKARRVVIALVYGTTAELVKLAPVHRQLIERGCARCCGARRSSSTSCPRRPRCSACPSPT